jgi:hypothetical protein
MGSMSGEDNYFYQKSQSKTTINPEKGYNLVG